MLPNINIQHPEEGGLRRYAWAASSHVFSFSIMK